MHVIVTVTRDSKLIRRRRKEGERERTEKKM